MAFCGSCGAQMQDGAAKCEKCGAAAGAAAPAASSSTGTGGMTDNVAAALSYITIVGIIFLLIEPYNKNKFVRFHAFQSIFLNLAWIVVFIALSIISIVLLPIPFLGAILSLMLHMAAGLGILILWLMLMYKAYNKERWVLPFIGPLAEKQA